MQDVFLLCLILGAIVLIAQIVMSTLGLHDLVPASLHISESGTEDGLDLLSVRSISAGVALFGAIGLWLTARGIPVLFTLPIALIAGLAATVTTAYLTRQMMRLESDGTLRLENSVGLPGTVYLPIPARRAGFGKVQFKLQGRTVELRALADEPGIIPTGAAVIVVSVLDAETVEVIPPPQIEGMDA